MPIDLSIRWLPLVSGWLIAVLATGLFALLAHGSVALLRKKVSPRWVMVLALGRVVIVFVFVLVLLQPVVSYTRLVAPRPEMIVLIDTSRSMELPVPSGKSRLEEVRSQMGKSDFASALERRYRLHYFTFDSSASPIRAGDLAGLRPTGASTNISASLTSADQFLRASGLTAEHVLLVSDGNDLGTDDPADTARRLGLPIDTLAPGSSAEAPFESELQIADFQYSPRVMLGYETRASVTLRGGRAGQTVALRLLEDGKEVATEEVRFSPGRGEQNVELIHRPTAAGLKRYEVRLSAGGTKPIPFTVRVVDTKNEVLILEDTWRWEFKFLRRVVEDDPSLRFTATLARGGGAVVQFGSPDRKVQLVGFPQGRAELDGFDTLILGDVDPRPWPRGFAANLVDLVTDEGKSLIVIAGPNLGRLAELPELHALLPVELLRDSGDPVVGPVEVRVTADGALSPFFAELGSGNRSRPSLDQIYPVLRSRPGATVLLEAAQKANATGNLIVMAEQTVGRGRVLFVGTDTLWKWQTLAAPNEATTTPYSRFWQQALRALAPAQPAGGGVSLHIASQRSRNVVGRAVVLTAVVQSDRILAGLGVQGVVELPEGGRLPLAFTSDPTAPGRFRAEFEASRSGAHRVLASVRAEGRIAAETTAELEVEQPHDELSDVSVDRANLARLSAATGGRVIDVSDRESWSFDAEQDRPPVPQTRTLELWNNGTLLLVLCGLLGADWLIRLLRGYV